MWRDRGRQREADRIRAGRRGSAEHEIRWETKGVRKKNGNKSGWIEAIVASVHSSTASNWQDAVILPRSVWGCDPQQKKENAQHQLGPIRLGGRGRFSGKIQFIAPKTEISWNTNNWWLLSKNRSVIEHKGTVNTMEGGFTSREEN